MLPSPIGELGLWGDRQAPPRQQVSGGGVPALEHSRREEPRLRCDDACKRRGSCRWHHPGWQYV